MTLPVQILPKIMQVIDGLQQGLTLTMACNHAGVSYTTVRRYIKDHPELGDAYTDAEQAGYDMMAEALLEIDRHPIYGQSVPGMASIISKNIQWYLARKRPSVYGDKVTHEVHLSADKEVIEALLRARERAQGYIEAVPVGRTVVAAYTDITPTDDTDDTDISSLL